MERTKRSKHETFRIVFLTWNVRNRHNTKTCRKGLPTKSKNLCLTWNARNGLSMKRFEPVSKVRTVFTRKPFEPLHHEQLRNGLHAKPFETVSTRDVSKRSTHDTHMPKRFNVFRAWNARIVLWYNDRKSFEPLHHNMLFRNSRHETQLRSQRETPRNCLDTKRRHVTPRRAVACIQAACGYGADKQQSVKQQWYCRRSEMPLTGRCSPVLDGVVLILKVYSYGRSMHQRW